MSTTCTQRQASDKIAAREDFKASALSGTSSPRGTGHLPECFLELFRESQPVYVVYSYATPIAWITKGGQVIHPVAKYSVTTSKHQSIARRSLR